MTSRYLEEKCRLCAARNIKLLYQVSTYNVVRCRKCGFVQVSDHPGGSELHTLYSEKYFQRGKYVKDKAIENVCRRRINWLINNGVKNTAKVLDVGCATGDFIGSAKSHFEMWGVDISEYAVAIAKEQNPDVAEHISCSMVEDIRFEDEFFDAIVLWDALEHIRDPLSVISNLTRHLKPGGILAISTPNIGSTVAKLMGRYWALMTVPEHLSFFDYNTLKILTEKVGLEVQNWVSQGTWGNLGFLINKAARVMPGFSFKKNASCKLTEALSRFVVYVPTGDIQYLAARKK